MKATRVFVVMALAWSMQAGVAYAYIDFWDRLSGPGPFTGFVIPYRFLCVSKSSDQGAFRTTSAGRSTPADAEADRTFATWLGPLEDAARFIPVHHAPVADRNADPKQQARIDCLRDERLRGYATLTNTFFWSATNRLFPSDPDNDLYKVKIFHTQVEYTFRLHETLDIGVAGGLGRFSGEAFTPFWRPSLTPVLVHFSPLAFKWPNDKGRSVKIALGLVTFFDSFDASDFCSIDPVVCASVDTSFRSEKERIYRLGVEFSLGPWFRR